MTISTKIYSTSSKKGNKISVSDSVFGQSWNDDLVHQVATSIAANKRISVAHTKNRGEVRGGGKKPWKQKGTARARHGSIRSPIWRGGGVTFGPRADKSYKKKINKKMRVRALCSVLSRKLKNGSLIFIDNIVLKDIKTKEAAKIVDVINSSFKDNKGKLLIVLPKLETTLKKSFSNLEGVELIDVSKLNAHTALSFAKIAISNPDEFVPLIEKRL